MSSENAVPGNPLGKLDFRATSDDAWYSVMVELDGDIMRLQYCGFSEEHDQVFKASDFKSLSEVDDFEARFRPMSVQVQDSECSKVLQGDVVCTAFSFQHEDVRFYDALVEGVEHREHASKQGQEENEEEECLCTFILLWIHGPNAGNLTATSVESICRVQSSAQIDPKVASFLNIARERFLRNGAPVLISINDESPNINHKLSFFQCLKQEAGHAQLFVNTISEGLSLSSMEIQLESTQKALKPKYLESTSLVFFLLFSFILGNILFKNHMLQTILSLFTALSKKKGKKEKLLSLPCIICVRPRAANPRKTNWC
ncbi:hypothetical protein I3843_04G186300 [Carya illinoinensis]|nr:hypothetical protein I3843_04G186300 [Carya illinoinensis]